jgi:hypothetical protein
VIVCSPKRLGISQFQSAKTAQTMPAKRIKKTSVLLTHHLLKDQDLPLSSV